MSQGRSRSGHEDRGLFAACRGAAGRVAAAVSLAALGWAGAAPGAAVLDDYNADRHADFAVYNEALGVWNIRTLSGASVAADQSWGGPDLAPVPGDYDGDGFGDLAVYNEAAGRWYIRALAGAVLAWDVAWGGSGFTAVPGDYDGDGRADLGLYRQAAGEWYVLSLANGLVTWARPWGGPGLTAVAGDYDGDGAADLAVYDQAAGLWYIEAVDGSPIAWAQAFGGPLMRPMAGDYDGDGATDLGVRDEVFRLWYAYSLERTSVVVWAQSCRATGATVGAADVDADGKADLVSYDAPSGAWSVRLSRSGYEAAAFAWAPDAVPASRTDGRGGVTLTLAYEPVRVEFGEAGMTALAGDYDGDGMADVAVYQPLAGVWHIRDGRYGVVRDLEFGGPGLEPVAGDFDGDGTADPALFLRESATWFVSLSSGYGVAVPWGSATCAPVPADYDGDGSTDLAVFLPETAAWWVIFSSGGLLAGEAWGWPGAVPAPADYDGDGRADLAVYAPGQSAWYVKQSGGGAVMGTVVGWGDGVPIPADYDGDGRADLAVYWPTGGVWAARSSATNLVVMGAWREGPSVSGAGIQAFPVACGGGDVRLAVFSPAAGALLLEPEAPAFDGTFGAVLQTLADARGAEPRLAFDRRVELVEVILGVAESVLDDYEQDQRDEKIALINTKLDGVSSNLAAVSRQLDVLMNSIAYTRADLTRNIWQASVADSVDKVKGTYDKLRQFNLASYRSLTPADRTNNVALFLSLYDRRDIEGCLDTLHHRVVGVDLSIPSSLELWKTQLVESVRTGSDVATCARMLETYFLEQINYQVQGVYLVGHVYQRRYGTNSVLFERYVTDTFLPRLTEQTDKYRLCVDEVVAASMAMEMDASARASALPAGVADAYARADFLGQVLSTNCPAGIWVRVIGEPETVQAYAAGGHFRYTGGTVTSAALPLVSYPLSLTRTAGNLRCGTYLAWNWYDTGSFQGYNEFKTADLVGMAKGVIPDPVAGQSYSVNAPWGTNTQGRGVMAQARRYDMAMNLLPDNATHGMTFGSAVLYVRNRPSWQAGVSERTGGNLWNADGCFSAPRTISTDPGQVFLEAKLMAVSYVWFWAKPSYSQRLNMTMPLRNGNAADTAVTFDLNASMAFQSRGGNLRTDGHPEAVASLLISGIAGWHTSTQEYGSNSYTPVFSGTFPAAWAGMLVFELTHATEWPGFAAYDQGVWEGIRFTLTGMRIR